MCNLIWCTETVHVPESIGLRHVEHKQQSLQSYFHTLRYWFQSHRLVVVSIITVISAFFFQGEPGNMGPPGTAGPPGRGIPGGKVSSRSANISCCNCQQQRRRVTVPLLVFVRGNQAHEVHPELWESRGWVWADPRWVRHRFTLHWSSREK